MMKNLLLIIPKYFGYEHYIQKELEKLFNVYVIYENLDEISLYYRYIYVYRAEKKEAIVKRYYDEKLKKAPASVDVVLVIRGETVTPAIFKTIKRAYPGAGYIMYQWDSVKNNPSAVLAAEQYDRVSTFDPDDAKRYGWHYRPLFYVEELCRPQPRTYDMAYICMLHSQRAELLVMLKKICRQNGLNLFSHLYQNPAVYVRHKYLAKDPIYTKLGRQDIQKRSLSLPNTYEIYGRSKIIVDYASPAQRGLTMRSIESIGSGCKLLTNNPAVRNEPFYNAENTALYSLNDFSVPKSFLHMEYHKIDPAIKEYYSLHRWLRDILGQAAEK